MAALVPHLLPQAPALRGLPRSYWELSHLSQLCPDAATAPWALPWAPGPCRFPPGIWMRYPVESGSPGMPHTPAGRNWSSRLIDEQRFRVVERLAPGRTAGNGTARTHAYLLLSTLWLPPTSLHGALAVYWALVIHRSMAVTSILLTGWRQARREEVPSRPWGSSWLVPITPGAPPRMFPVRTRYRLHRWVVASPQPRPAPVVKRGRSANEPATTGPLSRGGGQWFVSLHSGQHRPAQS